MHFRFTIILLLVLVSSSTVAAQSSTEPRTVVDYYMLLPNKYFEADRDQRLHWMLDPKRGAIVDIRNGYLYAPGDGAQTDIYTCIFKRNDGAYLVAVNYNDKDGVFETFLDFFVYERGNLTKVTKSVLPVPFSKDLFYELPRHGMTIRVTNASGKRLYDLVWNQLVFRVRRA
jgi:hypothetical protein